jgi:hypothetical protein
MVARSGSAMGIIGWIIVIVVVVVILSWLGLVH